MIRFDLFDWFGNHTHTDFGVRFCSIAELNQTQSTDWVRLSSIEFDFRMFNLLSRDKCNINLSNDSNIGDVVSWTKA